MGYFSHGFVFSQEPNWESIASIPLAIQGHKHKTKNLWVLEVSSRSIDKKNPFGDYVSKDRYDWTRKKEQKKLAPGIQKVTNRLTEIGTHLNSKREKFYFGVEDILFASQISRLAEVPTYYYAADDQGLDLGVNLTGGAIESFAYRVCNTPLVIKFRKDKFTVVVNKKELDAQADHSFHPIVSSALETWKTETDIVVKNATKKELELFNFYSIAAGQWPRKAGSAEKALGIGTWNLYSNLDSDYKILVTRKTPVAELVSKTKSRKSSSAKDLQDFNFQKFEIPKGFFFAGGSENQWVFSKQSRGKNESIVLDFAKFPPKKKTVAKEFAFNAECSGKGKWVFCSEAKNVKGLSTFEARIRDGSLKQNFNALEVDDPYKEEGISKAYWVGERVVAEPCGKKRRPLIELNGILKEADYLPESRELSLSSGVVKMAGGSDVFIWLGKGYELKRNKFVKTFDLFRDSTPSGFCSIDKDSFLFSKQGKLQLARRNQNPIKYLPEKHYVNGISTGPKKSVLIQNLDKFGDVAGFILFPKDESYIRLENKLLPKKACYQPNGFLRWLPQCKMIAFVTWSSVGMALFAFEDDDLLQLPRWDLKTGKPKTK